jgi:hypothetical protein
VAEPSSDASSHRSNASVHQLRRVFAQGTDILLTTFKFRVAESFALRVCFEAFAREEFR